MMKIKSFFLFFLGYFVLFSLTSCKNVILTEKYIHHIKLICNNHDIISPNVFTIQENEVHQLIVDNPINGAPAPQWASYNTECVTLNPLTGISTNATGVDHSQTVCVAHIEVTQANCVGTAIINVIPSVAPTCTAAPRVAPASASVTSTGSQLFTAFNMGANPEQTQWSSSNKFCATNNPITGTTTTATGHNSTSIQCFTDVTAINGPCWAQAVLNVAVQPSNCTSTTTNEPPPNSNYLGVTLYNDTACAYKDENVYVYLIAKPGNVYVITQRSTTADGYPVYTLDLPSNPVGLSVPYFTLSDLKQGGFYIKGGSGGTTELISARFYISLGSQLTSLQLTSATNYTSPTEITPWDIFEFGYDPNRVNAYGFNTSQVAGFSVPLWFQVTPLNNIPSNPPTLPIGLKLRDNSTPVRMGSQQQIINYYGTQNASGPQIFTLDFLKQVDGSGNTRIQSPGNPGVVTSSTYFDSSFTNFSTFYTSTYPNWTFRMCTNDPGPSSTIPYPGCAASGSTCASTTTFPQCTTGGNTCTGVPPTGNRTVGTCYMGYTRSGTFYFFTYQNDVAPFPPSPLHPCEGSIAYNGSTTPIFNPPAGGEGGLCAIALFTPVSGLPLTLCALQNNCYAGPFNPQIMAAIMRNVVTNKESIPQPGGFSYTRWTFLPPTSPTTTTAPYYHTDPFNYYARIWHELGIDFYAYGFGFDDAGGQSTTYTPNASTLTNLVVGIGW